MNEKRYEGTHSPDEVKVQIRTRTNIVRKDSRGHERDVDIYLPRGIVLTKQSMLSPESESTT
jgi:hypothetical protein